MEAQQRVGKHRLEPKYKTLNDVLGVTEAIRRGGWSKGSDITDAGADFRVASLEAAQRGEVLDVVEWMRAQHTQEDDE
jgi:hypothetical protein